MSKEKLTVGTVVHNIQTEVYWNVEIHSPHKRAKDELINFLKQIRDEVQGNLWKNNSSTEENINEVFNKYLNEK
jgi:hypothetical protein